MRRRKRWVFLWILVPVLILGILGYLFLHYLFDPTLYKKILEESLTQTLKKEVFIGKAKISLWDGIGFVFEDFHVKDHPSGPDLLYSRRLILRVKLLPLLKGEVKWKRIVLDQPILRLLRDREGRFNLWGDLLTAGKVKASHQKMIQILSTLFGGSITLRDGEVSLSDEGLGPTPLITEIKAFHFSLSEVSHRTPFPFRFSGNIIHSNKEGRVIISGTIRNIPEDMDLSKGSVDARVALKGIQQISGRRGRVVLRGHVDSRSEALGMRSLWHTLAAAPKTSPVFFKPVRSEVETLRTKFETQQGKSTLY